MTTPAFERDPYLATLAASVQRSGVDGGRPYAVLDDTILYPEGGGQPPDHGFLGEIAVVDVQKQDAEIRHYLAAAVPEGPVSVRLDWARRFDHMQQHTGQHLLTAVAAERFGWATTSFHLGGAICDIELDVASLATGDLDALEEAVAAEIRAARTVTGRRVTAEEYASLPVRSRGLPEGFQGDIRLVEIAGVDLNTCGGTHVRSTAEIESLALLGTEAIRGGTRLHFLAGSRVRRRLHEHEARTASLRKLLKTSDGELVPTADARLAELLAAQKRIRSLEEELASAAAEAMAGAPEPVTDRHFDGKDLPFLQLVARSLGKAPKLAFLTATQGASSCFVLTAGEGVAADVQALGREVATLLGAKGGGSARLFQGKANNLEGRGNAVERLRKALASASASLAGTSAADG